MNIRVLGEKEQQSGLIPNLALGVDLNPAGTITRLWFLSPEEWSHWDLRPNGRYLVHRGAKKAIVAHRLAGPSASGAHQLSTHKSSLGKLSPLTEISAV